MGAWAVQVQTLPQKIKDIRGRHHVETLAQPVACRHTGRALIGVRVGDSRMMAQARSGTFSAVQDGAALCLAARISTNGGQDVGVALGVRISHER